MKILTFSPKVIARLEVNDLPVKGQQEYKKGLESYKANRKGVKRSLDHNELIVKGLLYWGSSMFPLEQWNIVAWWSYSPSMMFGFVWSPVIVNHEDKTCPLVLPAFLSLENMKDGFWALTKLLHRKVLQHIANNMVTVDSLNTQHGYSGQSGHTTWLQWTVWTHNMVTADSLDTQHGYSRQSEHTTWLQQTVWTHNMVTVDINKIILAPLFVLWHQWSNISKNCYTPTLWHKHWCGQLVMTRLP